MNQLPENSLRIYDVTLVTSYLIGLWSNKTSVYMPNYLPQPQAQQSSTQVEREEVAVQRQDLEARELEAERRTRALNLNAVRDAETKSPAPSNRSSWTRISHDAGHDKVLLD